MKPENILNYYPLAPLISIAKIPTGLIHETYKIDSQSGYFILQKLNPIFTVDLMYDAEAVGAYLERKGLIAQRLIKTREGKLWVADNGEVWRLFTYIPGQVYSKLENANLAYEAGRILGKFHQALCDFNYEFKHVRPLHHATEKLFELFVQAAEQNQDPEIEELKKAILEIPHLLLPKDLRRTVTHGDPKITNVIFQNSTACALIDIDGCSRRHNVLVELGDAFRSWCSREEDDIDNSFNLEFFEAGFSGYLEGSRKFITDEELKLITQAVKLITLELASRFLRDYFEDKYFGYDRAKYGSRKEHNLARTRGQIVLYYDVVKKENLISEIAQRAYLNN